MKGRPILFSAPMVRAILDGRKTQTRRVVKPQPHVDGSGNFCQGETCWGQHSDRRPNTENFARWRSPYGVPGDRLWVRETWACHFATDDQPPRDIDPALWSVRYAADGHIRPAASDGSQALPEQFTKTRVSIHMPRWASRITLEITEVRVERLQAISWDDAIAEGVVDTGRRDGEPWPHCHVQGVTSGYEACAVATYLNLWEHINGEGSVKANPFVWCVSFRRVAQEARAA